MLLFFLTFLVLEISADCVGTALEWTTTTFSAADCVDSSLTDTDTGNAVLGCCDESNAFAEESITDFEKGSCLAPGQVKIVTYLNQQCADEDYMITMSNGKCFNEDPGSYRTSWTGACVRSDMHTVSTLKQRIMNIVAQIIDNFEKFKAECTGFFAPVICSHVELSPFSIPGRRALQDGTAEYSVQLSGLDEELDAAEVTVAENGCCQTPSYSFTTETPFTVVTEAPTTAPPTVSPSQFAECLSQKEVPDTCSRASGAVCPTGFQWASDLSSVTEDACKTAVVANNYLGYDYHSSSNSCRMYSSVGNPGDLNEDYYRTFCYRAQDLSSEFITPCLASTEVADDCCDTPLDAANCPTGYACAGVFKYEAEWLCQLRTVKLGAAAYNFREENAIAGKPSACRVYSTVGFPQLLRRDRSNKFCIRTDDTDYTTFYPTCEDGKEVPDSCCISGGSCPTGFDCMFMANDVDTQDECATYAAKYASHFADGEAVTAAGYDYNSGTGNCRVYSEVGNDSELNTDRHRVYCHLSTTQD